MQTLEHVLEDMETEPGVQHFWSSDSAAPATTSAVLTSSQEEIPAFAERAVNEPSEILTFSAPENPLSGSPAFQLEMPRPGIGRRILHVLFGRRRLAA